VMRLGTKLLTLGRGQLNHAHGAIMSAPPCALRKDQPD
jgi:hypothetical protein